MHAVLLSSVTAAWSSGIAAPAQPEIKTSRAISDLGARLGEARAQPMPALQLRHRMRLEQKLSPPPSLRSDWAGAATQPLLQRARFWGDLGRRVLQPGLTPLGVS